MLRKHNKMSTAFVQKGLTHAEPSEFSGILRDSEGVRLDILNGTNETGKNARLAKGDRGQVVFFVAINQEFVNNFPYLPAG